MDEKKRYENFQQLRKLVGIVIFTRETRDAIDNLVANINDIKLVYKCLNPVAKTDAWYYCALKYFPDMVKEKLERYLKVRADPLIICRRDPFTYDLIGAKFYVAKYVPKALIRLYVTTNPNFKLHYLEHVSGGLKFWQAVTKINAIGALYAPSRIQKHPTILKLAKTSPLRPDDMYELNFVEDELIRILTKRCCSIPFKIVKVPQINLDRDNVNRYQWALMQLINSVDFNNISLEQYNLLCRNINGLDDYQRMRLFHASIKYDYERIYIEPHIIPMITDLFMEQPYDFINLFRYIFTKGSVSIEEMVAKMRDVCIDTKQLEEAFAIIYYELEIDFDIYYKQRLETIFGKRMNLCNKSYDLTYYLDDAKSGKRLDVNGDLAAQIISHNPKYVENIDIHSQLLCNWFFVNYTKYVACINNVDYDVAAWYLSEDIDTCSKIPAFRKHLVTYLLSPLSALQNVKLTESECKQLLERGISYLEYIKESNEAMYNNIVGKIDFYPRVFNEATNSTRRDLLRLNANYCHIPNELYEIQHSDRCFEYFARHTWIDEEFFIKWCRRNINHIFFGDMPLLEN